MNFREATSCLIKLLALFVMLIHHVGGHGRLMEPPARNGLYNSREYLYGVIFLNMSLVFIYTAMWRFGFPNPVNYNDNGNLLSSFTLLTWFFNIWYTSSPQRFRTFSVWIMLNFLFSSFHENAVWKNRGWFYRILFLAIKTCLTLFSNF